MRKTLLLFGILAVIAPSHLRAQTGPNYPRPQFRGPNRGVGAYAANQHGFHWSIRLLGRGEGIRKGTPGLKTRIVAKRATSQYATL